mgnify:CR=1 FL=1
MQYHFTSFFSGEKFIFIITVSENKQQIVMMPQSSGSNTMTIYDIFQWIDWPDDQPEGEVGQWDEGLSLCATPVPCESEVDSQLIYEECWPSPYARYHWTGDYLYIGQVSE